MSNQVSRGIIQESVLKAGIFFSLLLGVQLTPAFADDHHFGEPGFEDHHLAIDNSKWQQVNQNIGRPEASSGRSGHTYEADASAVIQAPLDKVLSVSLDYDHYTQMGMPNVEDCRVVGSDSTGDTIYVWSSQSYSVEHSQHYLEAFVRRGLPNGAVGIAWHLVHRQASWPFEEDSALARLDGTFYMLPLEPGKVYVRYFLSADLLPEHDPWWAPGWAIEGTFRDGIVDVIKTVGRFAASR